MFRKSHIILFLLICAVSLFGTNDLFAQNKIKSYSDYLAHLPRPDFNTSDQFLEQNNPDVLDRTNDIDSLEHQLHNYANAQQGAILTKNIQFDQVAQSVTPILNKKTSGKAKNTSAPIAVAPPPPVPPKVTVSDDSCLAIANRIQRLDIDFNASYKAIEDMYNYRVSVAHEQWRAVRAQTPCGDDADCKAQQTKMLNSGLIDAAKNRITSNASVINAQVRQLEPILNIVDAMMPSQITSVKSADSRKILRSTSTNTLQLLQTISERIKLNRIYIANCAKLAQQK